MLYKEKNRLNNTCWVECLLVMWHVLGSNPSAFNLFSFSSIIPSVFIAFLNTPWSKNVK